MIKKEWWWINQLNQNKMSYELHKRAERYVDILSSGYDGQNLADEFEWLVQAVLSDPTHARDMLIDAIKSHTK